MRTRALVHAQAGCGRGSEPLRPPRFRPYATNSKSELPVSVKLASGRKAPGRERQPARHRVNRMERARIDGVEARSTSFGDRDSRCLGVGAWAGTSGRPPSPTCSATTVPASRAAARSRDQSHGRARGHCRLLMRRVLERARVVGHSFQCRDRASWRSISRTRCRRSSSWSRRARRVRDAGRCVRAFGPAGGRRYRAGDRTGAVDMWCRGVFGPGLPWPTGAGPGALRTSGGGRRTRSSRELPAVGSGRSRRRTRVA